MTRHQGFALKHSCADNKKAKAKKKKTKDRERKHHQIWLSWDLGGCLPGIVYYSTCIYV
jgi:hypothetical protein